MLAETGHEWRDEHPVEVRIGALDQGERRRVTAGPEPIDLQVVPADTPVEVHPGQCITTR